MKLNSVRLPLVGVALIALCSLLAIWSLCSGTLRLTPMQVLNVLTGQGTPVESLTVMEWRLPRMLMGLLTGASLGVSGALFQSVMRNPLGSPDVMGFNTGAWSGVLVAMVLLSQNQTSITTAALAGGLLSSLLVWLLAWRNGIETLRLIIVGIGIRAMLVAFNTCLLLRASLDTALSAGLWYAGSLNGVTWGKIMPAAPLMLLLLLVSLLLTRRMQLLEMGDDTARGLGIAVEPTRLTLIVIGVLLTAAATSLAGPVSFVALVAPHIARRLSGTARRELLQAALCGAALLLAADICARQLFMPYQLPVGVITVSLGGGYLLALLIQESRKQ